GGGGVRDCWGGGGHGWDREGVESWRCAHRGAGRRCAGARSGHTRLDARSLRARPKASCLSGDRVPSFGHLRRDPEGAGQGMAWRAIGAMLLASVACSVTVHAADLQSAQMRESDANALQIEIMPLLTSDYIYRGVSLSGRRPSVGTEIDVERNGFYVHTEFRSVKLPTQPAAEITLNGGYRFDGPWETKLDLGATYFY